MQLSTIIAFVFFIGIVATDAQTLSCWECHNANTNEECLQTGKVKLCGELDAICEDVVRHDQNNQGTVIIEKRCKQKHACNNNVIQNERDAYPIQCNLKSPTSTCRCCCDTDLCNSDLQTCWNSIKQYDAPVNELPTVTTCGAQPNVPRNADMQCEGNMNPGTACVFKCHDGYYMRGRNRITCLANLKWSSPPPRCEPIICYPALPAPGNGSVRCSDGIRHRSHCRFTCEAGYELKGSQYSDCIAVGRNRIGRWTKRAPYCKPLFCPPRGTLKDGSVSCSNGRRFGSTCSHRCDSAYEVYPADRSSSQCLNGTWSKPLPCCSLRCPPGVLMDFIVVMDSSSSVGAENWVKMKDFVRSFLDDFTVSESTAHYAVIRYNREVDTSTQILLNDFPNDINGLLSKFDEIPYDGSGTFTGNALRHTAEVLLTTGNRPLARDVVLLITDGASKDEVSEPARLVRNTGALLYVLPILPPRGELDFDQIEQIAGPGNDENILRAALEGGFDALDESFAAEMSELLCSDPCFDPFENA